MSRKLVILDLFQMLKSCRLVAVSYLFSIPKNKLILNSCRIARMRGMKILKMLRKAARNNKCSINSFRFCKEMKRMIALKEGVKGNKKYRRRGKIFSIRWQ
jgi:hypothetical protein